MIKTMYVTIFFSVLLPIGIIWSLLSLSFMYKIHKYNLIKKSTTNHVISYQLAEEVIEMLEYIIPIYGVSNVVFVYLVEGSLENMGKYTILMTIISLIHNFLPMDQINEWILPVKKANPTNMNYKLAIETVWNCGN